MTRKIYWVQQYFNEELLLKLKLKIIYPYIDRIIFSESNITHQGNPKSFNFDHIINEKWTKEFENPAKIIIQKVYDSPLDYTNLKTDPNKDEWYNRVICKLNSQTHWPKDQKNYGLDSYQKEILLRPLGLLNPEPDDIIIFTDLDEFIKPEVLVWLRENFNPDKIYRFDCKLFFYRFNLQIVSEKWQSPLAMSYEKFLNNSICTMRNFSPAEIIEDAGWHFSYLGNTDTIRTKLESFGEASLNQQRIKDNLPNVIEYALKYNRDLFGRYMEFRILPFTTENFPLYLVEHLNEYKDLIL